MKKSIDIFIDLIIKKRYYDAHEVLEEIWFPNRKNKDPDTLLLKAFINASVSFELIKRNRQPQSLKVWGNYEKYIDLIEKCSPENRELFKKVKIFLEDYREKLIS